MNRFLSAALLASLALGACDKPDPPEPTSPWAPLITWDDAGGRILLAGQPAHVVKSWDFRRGAAGFEAANADQRIEAGQGLVVAATAPDPVLRTPAGLDVAGKDAPLVVVRLTRTRPTDAWDGALYYSTRRHGESPQFMTYPANGPPPMAGRTALLVYDLSNPRVGGRDWTRSIIEQVRVDLDAGAGGEVVVHQVALIGEPNR
ncbi:hypothetical protein [Phenylobacterium sp.]|uniref:hypothetical protein n=1 Tax=Phenylobacterium sp. TaxID=1871053 RepID=UPI0028A263A9|nr:hypothetical protein [Phenylobacterium sp.]